MLHFIISRKKTLQIETVNASSFEIKSAEAYAGKVIPFSYIHVTSGPYFRKIKKYLASNDAGEVEELNQAQNSALLEHEKHPKDLKFKNYSSVSELQKYLIDNSKGNDSINIVVMNGIGTGFGDNYVGLGMLQRLLKLLSPLKVNIHLMQTMNVRTANVYMRHENIFVTNNCMPVSTFFKMDYIINLTGMLGFPEFENNPLARFFSIAFSINNLVPPTSLHPILKLDKTKTDSFKTAIQEKFNNNNKTVLFHPKASSPIRTMKSECATTLVNELIKANYNVISAFPYPNPSKGFYDFSRYSNSIDDFAHIIAACDGLISVGTVAYHLGAALSIPTVLLPTVKADVESSKILPEVLMWLPNESEKLVLNLHKGRDEEDLKTAETIWANVNPEQVVKDFTNHCNKFDQQESFLAPKVGVVIPHFGDSDKLSRCMDALVKVNGFDPAYLYVIDNNENNRYFTVAVNLGIEKALRDNCDYIWVLNNDTEPDANYINANLERFKANEHIGLIGGKNLKTSKPDRIYWGGSLNAFPTGQHKAGYVSRGDLNIATKESWATFSSVIIKADAIRSVGMLDETMRMVFSDSDYCFSLIKNGWQIWYEPNAIVYHETGVTAGGANKKMLDIFREDKKQFIKKWKATTGCVNNDFLQDAIFLMIGYLDNR